MPRKKGKGSLSRWVLLLLFLFMVLALWLVIKGPLQSKLFKPNDDKAEIAIENEGGYEVKDAYKDYIERKHGEPLHTDGVREEEVTERKEEIENDDLLDNEDVSVIGEEEQEYEIIKDGDCLLALVTKETKLKSDYVPPDLEPIPSYMNLSYDMYLRAEALELLKAMWYAAKEDGVTLSIRSAYRSYSN